MTGEGEVHRKAVFWIGILALFAAGVSAALRAATAAQLKATYLDTIDPARSVTLIAEALGSAFLGFCLALVVTSLFLDRIGMKRMIMVAAASFVIGPLLVILCGSFGPAGAYQAIWLGMFVNGLGWGATEGTINPMVSALYPEDTTHRMNILHAWWPAGLVVGGLLGILGTGGAMDWRLMFALVPLMGIAIALWAATKRFPQTTSAALGVSRGGQMRELIRRPSFFIWFALMLLTAASELAPGQWVDVSLSNVVGMRGVLLLSYVAAIQFVGRHFAGPIERRFSTEGMLCLSCVLCTIGLFSLGYARSPAMAILSATLWGAGVCFIWPTMIAVAAQRYPRAGALSIGLMGVAGSISTWFVLPVLGAIYDSAKIEAAGGAARFEALGGEQLQAVLTYAASQSFKAVAVIPAVLVAVFGLLWLLRGRTARTASAAAE
ncbi:MFS transporter [Sphingomonas quercus]|uniref:MFS transporter n=1 Tax=Sphingomonas quercus TaxID=2842451 RepID=A0ABS6BH51_9SPHN|nr:MFS transporter [Sphingomonas quercus]MBU3077509.1 MFS transporter [Sphingomonas quercus]